MLNEVDWFTVDYMCKKLNNNEVVMRRGFNREGSALIYSIQ